MDGSLFWLASFFVLVLGLFYGGRGIYEERIRRQLRQGGTDTEAVVIGHQAMRTGRGAVYYVRYRYHHQGQRYEKEERVSSGRYNVWPKGTRISVCYLPQNPYVVRITGEKNQLRVLGVVLIVTGIILMVVALLFTLPL